MSTRTEDLLGQTIAGYRLLDVLGKGGMSVVFLAQHQDAPQDHVALKILRPSHLSKPETRISASNRFLREAQAASQLHHPHILPVFQYGESDGVFYMSMPLISGGSLDAFLSVQQKPLSFFEIVGYLYQLAGAVDCAHRHSLIHRDIKPSNVLIDEQQRLYLTDFGIVHLFNDGFTPIDQAPTSFTVGEVIHGTPSYMAPELFQGEQAGPASDIYALGILLYLLVTGQVPFKADNPLILALKHVNDIPVPPHILRPDLPVLAEEVILRALAKNPADRFATASALAEAFDAAIKGQPIVPIPEDPDPTQLRPLVFQSAPASVNGRAQLADESTQISLPQARGPQSRKSRRVLLLLAGVIPLGVGLLGLLFMASIFHLYPPHDSGKQVLPRQPSAIATRAPERVPAVAGLTPTLIPQSRQTPASQPVPSPTLRPTPLPTPTPTLVPKPSPTPAPRLTPSPTPSSSPTPRSTSVPTSTAGTHHSSSFRSFSPL